MVVGVVTTLLVGRQGKCGPVLAGVRGLSLLQNALNDFGVHQAFYRMGAGGSCPSYKAAEARKFSLTYL